MEQNIPASLRYTSAHEWATLVTDQPAPTGTSIVRVGITDYAQSQLGDIVFVTLPEVGDTLAAEQPLGEVESTKSVSDIYAPIAGTVHAVNPELISKPETINADPYGAGWLVELAVDEPNTLQSLLDAEAYAQLI